MGKPKRVTLFLVLTLAIFFVNIVAAQEVEPLEKSPRKEIDKTFKARGVVKIQTMSGSCIFKKGKNGEISVKVKYDPSGGMFEPQMEEDRAANTLVLRDKFQGGDEGSNALWIVTVPEKTNIKSSSISGNFSAEGLNSEIAAKTVSGDIYIKNCSGNLHIACVSGGINAENLKGSLQLKGISSDMELNKLSGKMEINTASGEIKATELEGEISCAVASGDVLIKKAQGGF
ncbi:MAG: hypothetical protein QG657_3196, partial [Acidobacteriota bacterium]|nr:hypothetical protein [Acidobacteriota bacterium]